MLVVMVRLTTSICGEMSQIQEYKLYGNYCIKLIGIIKHHAIHHHDQRGTYVQDTFCWCDPSSEEALLSTTTIACVLDFKPIAALPCFTASMAYSIWWMRPWGLHVVISLSYWLRCMVEEEWRGRLNEEGWPKLREALALQGVMK